MLVVPEYKAAEHLSFYPPRTAEGEFQGSNTKNRSEQDRLAGFRSLQGSHISNVATVMSTIQLPLPGDVSKAAGGVRILQEEGDRKQRVESGVIMRMRECGKSAAGFVAQFGFWKWWFISLLSCWTHFKRPFGSPDQSLGFRWALQPGLKTFSGQPLPAALRGRGSTSLSQNWKETERRNRTITLHTHQRNLTMH